MKIDAIQTETVYIVDHEGYYVGMASIPYNEIEETHHITVLPPRLQDPDAYRLRWDFGEKVWMQEFTLQGNAKIWEDVNNKRNRLLLESDWAVLPDVPFTEEKKKAVIEYRRTLRDLPSMFSDPRDVKFPLSPL